MGFLSLNSHSFGVGCSTTCARTWWMWTSKTWRSWHDRPIVSVSCQWTKMAMFKMPGYCGGCVKFLYTVYGFSSTLMIQKTCSKHELFISELAWPPVMLTLVLFEGKRRKTKILLETNQKKIPAWPVDQAERSILFGKIGAGCWFRTFGLPSGELT